jgi:1-deoxy-D-xylulose-5-phosphate reductoisomerase
MRVPILYCLTWPERTPFAFAPFDPVRFRSLTFEPAEPARYPAIALGFSVLRAGGDAGATLNAADEVLTELFLQGTVPFLAITEGVAKVLERHPPRPLHGLDDVLAADRAARATARGLAGSLAAGARS